MENRLYQQMHKLEKQHWWSIGRRAMVTSLLQSSKLPKNPPLLTSAIVHLLRRCFPTGNTRAELSLLLAPINRLLAKLFTSERRLRAELPFGIFLIRVTTC